MSRRALTVIITFLSVTSARAADMATTAYFSPSLSRESNPLVAYAGFGLPGLIAVQLCLLSFVIAGLLFYWKAKPVKKLPESPKNIWDYASLTYFGRKMSPGKFLISFLFTAPSNKWQLLRLAAFVVSWGATFFSLCAVFSWWAIYGWHLQEYIHLRNYFCIGRQSMLELWVTMLMFVPLTVAFYRLEWSEYRAAKFSGYSNKPNQKSVS